ncbi:MAG: tetratricopeptide repeat-containing sensor histidine kinase [Anaerolineae bacterium]
MLFDTQFALTQQVTPCETSQIDTALTHVESIKYNDYQKVIELSQSILLCAQKLEYWRGMSQSYCLIAWGYLRQSDFASASGQARQALSIARAHHLLMEEANACSVLGAVYYSVGDEAAAVEMCLRQITIGKELGEKAVEASGTADLGSIFLGTDNADQGLKLIKDSLKTFDELHLPHEKYFYLLDMAHYMDKWGDKTQAYSLYESALELGITYNITEAISVSLNGMARAKARMGDHKTAFEMLEQALNATYSSKSALTADTLTVIAEIQAQQNQWDVAIGLYVQALEIAAHTNNLKVLIEANSALSDIYEVQGDYQKALLYCRDMQRANEKLFNENTRSRMQILNVLYETERATEEAQLNQVLLEAAEQALREYKDSEAERIETERLRVKLAQERELSDLKERIMTRISHEFRTPLSIIRTSTELVTRYGDKLTEEKRREYFDRISEQFVVIEKQLNDISAVMHTKSTQVADVRHLVNLAALSESAVQIARNQTKKDNPIELDLQAVDRDVWVAQPLLHAVLSHLLANALKFSQDTIRLKIQLIQDILRIVVEDRGIGIPESEQKRVFEPLVRGTNVEDIRGSGLGLTIVRDYVELLQGKIELTSEVHKGTRVVVTIPLTPE